VPTADVHHKREHHGDPALFWDRLNLEALCHAHHSLVTASRVNERRGSGNSVERGGIDSSGRKLSRTALASASQKIEIKGFQ
jgi:hypothetical protein